MVTYIFELTETYTAYLAKVREGASTVEYTFLVEKTAGNVTVPASDVLNVIQVAQSCAGNIFQYTAKFRDMMEGVLLESQIRGLNWVGTGETVTSDTPPLVAEYIESKNSETQDLFTQMVGRYYAPSNICGDYEPAKGDQGEKGDNGLTPEFTATAKSGDVAAVSVTPNITEDSYMVSLDFTIPKGQAGADGKDGRDGQDGKTPTLRYNKTEGFWEYTLDGGNIWTKVEGSESLPSTDVTITDLRPQI